MEPGDLTRLGEMFWVQLVYSVLHLTQSSAVQSHLVPVFSFFRLPFGTTDSAHREGARENRCRVERHGSG